MREKKKMPPGCLALVTWGKKRLYCFSLWLYDESKMTHHPHCYIHVTQLLNKEMACGSCGLETWYDLLGSPKAL